MRNTFSVLTLITTVITAFVTTLAAPNCLAKSVSVTIEVPDSSFQSCSITRQEGPTQDCVAGCNYSMTMITGVDTYGSALIWKDFKKSSNEVESSNQKRDQANLAESVMRELKKRGTCPSGK